MSRENEKRFDGEVAIVTGSSRGIGREIVKLLAARGASVVVCGRVRDAVDGAVQEIEYAGGRAVARYDDISTESGANSLVQSTMDLFGRIDVLVNNAGIYGEVPFADMSFDDFDRMMKVNTYGTYFVTRAAWPHFIEQNYGRVLLMGSSAGYVSQANASHYAASKGSLVGLGRTLAVEGEAHGITVNMMMPAAATQMGEETLSTPETEKARELVQRLMPASLVAPVAAWMVHRDNYMKGEIIEAGSGRAAVNFIGTAPGFWDAELTVEDLFEFDRQVLGKDGYIPIKLAPEVADWIVANTSWEVSGAL